MVLDKTKYSSELWTFFSVNKQINDKERIAAAMENPNLKKIVEECILDAN